jgi:hypothetical protein
MATPTLSIPDLAKHLAALTGEQALDLLSSIEGLTARAAAHKAAVVAAEAERDAWAPRLVCPCGEPATVSRHIAWETCGIRVGISTWRPVLTGGFVMSNNDLGDAPQTGSAAIDAALHDLWVSCEKPECGWTRIPGGRDAIVEWE